MSAFDALAGSSPLPLPWPATSSAAEAPSMSFHVPCMYPLRLASSPALTATSTTEVTSSPSAIAAFWRRMLNATYASRMT